MEFKKYRKAFNGLDTDPKVGEEVKDGLQSGIGIVDDPTLGGVGKKGMDPALTGSLIHAGAFGLNKLDIGGRQDGDLRQPGMQFGNTAAGASLGMTLAPLTGGLSVPIGAALGLGADLFSFDKNRQKFTQEVRQRNLRRWRDTLRTDMGNRDWTGRMYMREGGEVTVGPPVAIRSKGPGDPPGKATAADSLAVYNQALKVIQYYESKNYKKDAESKNWMGFDAFKHMDERYKDFKKDKHLVWTDGGRATASTPDSIYRKNHPSNKNQFYQRENAYFKLDTRAPMQLYDRRIEPQLDINYSNNNVNDRLYNDQVNIYQYDPIMVKPYALLTPQEKVIRDKREGRKAVSAARSIRPSKVTPTPKPPPPMDPALSMIPGNDMVSTEPPKDLPNRFIKKDGKLVPLNDTDYQQLLRDNNNVSPVTPTGKVLDRSKFNLVPSMKDGGQVEGPGDPPKMTFDWKTGKITKVEPEKPKGIHVLAYTPKNSDDDSVLRQKKVISETNLGIDLAKNWRYMPTATKKIIGEEKSEEARRIAVSEVGYTAPFYDPKIKKIVGERFPSATDKYGFTVINLLNDDEYLEYKRIVNESALESIRNDSPIVSETLKQQKELLGFLAGDRGEDSGGLNTTFKQELERGSGVLKNMFGSVTPHYVETPDQLDSVLNTIPDKGKFMYMDHTGERFFGHPKEEFAKKLGTKNFSYCIGGSCYGSSGLAPLIKRASPTTKVFMSKSTDSWEGFNPGKSGFDGIFPKGFESYRNGGHVKGKKNKNPMSMREARQYLLGGVAGPGDYAAGGQVTDPGPKSPRPIGAAPSILMQEILKNPALLQQAYQMQLMELPEAPKAPAPPPLPPARPKEHPQYPGRAYFVRHGGETGNMVPVELEDQEIAILEMADGSWKEVLRTDGVPSHEEGGFKTMLPKGTQVFNRRLRGQVEQAMEEKDWETIRENLLPARDALLAKAKAKGEPYATGSFATFEFGGEVGGTPPGGIMNMGRMLSGFSRSLMLDQLAANDPLGVHDKLPTLDMKPVVSGRPGGFEAAMMQPSPYLEPGGDEKPGRARVPGSGLLTRRPGKLDSGTIHDAATVLNLGLALSNTFKGGPPRVNLERPVAHLASYDDRPVQDALKNTQEGISTAVRNVTRSTRSVGDTVHAASVAGANLIKAQESASIASMQGQQTVDNANAQVRTNVEMARSDVRNKEQMLNSQLQENDARVREAAVTTNLQAAFGNQLSKQQEAQMKEQARMNMLVQGEALKVAMEQDAFESDEFSQFRTRMQGEEFDKITGELGDRDDLENPIYSDLLGTAEEEFDGFYKDPEELTAGLADAKSRAEAAQALPDGPEKEAALAAVNNDLSKMEVASKAIKGANLESWQRARAAQHFEAQRAKLLRERAGEEAARNAFREEKGIPRSNMNEVLKLINNR